MQGRGLESSEPQQEGVRGDTEADSHLRETLIGGVDRSSCCRGSRWPGRAEDPPSIICRVCTQSSLIIHGSSVLQSAADTELANAEPLLLRTTRGEVPTSLWSQVFVVGSLHNLVLCLSM